MEHHFSKLTQLVLLCIYTHVLHLFRWFEVISKAFICDAHVKHIKQIGVVLHIVTNFPSVSTTGVYHFEGIQDNVLLILAET